MADAGIVRNRAKIAATVANARALVALQAAEGDGVLDRLFWSVRPPAHARPQSLADVPATSPESVRLARELKRRGFTFVGPTTAYAAMQALGVVDDHLVGCVCAGAAPEA